MVCYMAMPDQPDVRELYELYGRAVYRRWMTTAAAGRSAGADGRGTRRPTYGYRGA